MRKTRLMRRMLSSVCAAAMVMTTASVITLPANAKIANLPYERHESLAPHSLGMSAKDLLNWSPDKDTDARYTRSTIPLRKDRINGPLAHEFASTEGKILSCAIPQNNHDGVAAQGSDSFTNYAFTDWQYVDTFVYWNGTGKGMFSVPTPDIIDAAHKNGVPILPTIGFTDSNIKPEVNPDAGLESNELFYQKNEDGTFPVADKMIEVARYYGFDGYFYNHETPVSQEKMDNMVEMMLYMHEKAPDLIISYYDSNVVGGNVSYRDSVDADNSFWIKKQTAEDAEKYGGKYEGLVPADQFFMNYNWGGNHENPNTTRDKITPTIQEMNKQGRSEFDAYAGLELQGHSYNKVYHDHLLVDPDTKKLRISMALFVPSSTMGLASDPADFHEKEKMFWVGESGDPFIQNRDPSDESEQNWIGMSRFVADKTVITFAPFTTNFNTGHGKQWWIDGEVKRTREWNNRSMQDIMPTWTWTVRTDGTKLNAAYDFEDAYTGGNSIKLSGTLDAPNEVLLYSTKVNNAAAAEIIYKTNTPDAKVQIGLASGDSYDQKNFKYYDLTTTELGNGWVKGTADLTADSGREIIAVSVKVDGNAADFQLNLGGLSLLDSAAGWKLDAPKSFTLDEISYMTANTAEARVYWDAVPQAASYEVYAKHEDGTSDFLTASPNNAVYLSYIERKNAEAAVTLSVVPVGADGVRGNAIDKEIIWALSPNATEEVDTFTGVNVCLGAEVTDKSGEETAEPASKALDGTSDGGSKWCKGGVGSGWMSIKLDAPKNVKRLRIEHAEAGGEEHNMNTRNFEVQYKDDGNVWQTAYSTTNNEAAVTDVDLQTPVTAQEWKLVINQATNGGYPGVRIYEWQMFESTDRPGTPPVGMQFASAFNGAGAADTFKITNLPLGATVRLYKDITAKDVLAEKKAESSEAEITGLNFGAEAGLVYYTVQDTNGNMESPRMSVPYEKENAETTPTPKAEDVAFVSFIAPDATSASGNYVNVTVNNLQEGDVVTFYDMPAARSNQEGVYIKKSMPVPAGQTSVTVSMVKFNSGNQIQLSIKRNGMLPSDNITVEVLNPTTPDATYSAVKINQRAVLSANGETVNLTAKVLGENNPSQEVTWSLENASDSQIDEFGKLTIGNETVNAITVTATSVADPTLSDSILVMLDNGDKTPPKQWPISVDPAIEHGKVTVEPSAATAGTKVEVTVTPDSGYEPVAGSLTFNGQQIEGTSFTMPDEAVVISAKFDAVVIPTYTVTVSDAITNGKVTVDKTDAQAGDEITVTVTPNDGFELVPGSLKVNGKAVKNNKFIMGEENAEVTAEFRAIETEPEKPTNPEPTNPKPTTPKPTEPKPTAPVTYTLRFQTNGGSKIDAVSGSKGTAVDLSKHAPTREGFDFAGWYADEKLTQQVTSVNLTQDMTVYAKWTAKLVGNPFTDVPEDKYFHESVLWAVSNKITAGVSDTSFGPSQSCTRGQIVTFLWSAAGKPDPKSDKNPFADVKQSDYYYNAVLWAVENGVTSGISADRFGPKEICTRAQAMTFLWSAQGKPEVSGKTAFSDVNASDYFYNAVQWAVANGVTAGVDDNRFGPKEICTRSQIVTFLYKVYG